MTWKTRIDERREQEESKKRIAATAVNDISFPAIGGGAGAGAGSWGSPAAPPPMSRTTTTTTTYAERLRAAVAAESTHGETSTTKSYASPTYSEFRHPHFGTSRSSRNDTYYDADEDYAAAPPPPSFSSQTDDEWKVVDKKKTPPLAASTTRDNVGLNHVDYDQDYEEEYDEEYDGY
jgi:hypothetical protein